MNKITCGWALVALFNGSILWAEEEKPKATHIILVPNGESEPPPGHKLKIQPKKMSAEKFSYCLGAFEGDRLLILVNDRKVKFAEFLNLDVLIQGLMDGAQAKPMKLSESAVSNVVRENEIYTPDQIMDPLFKTMRENAKKEGLKDTIYPESELDKKAFSNKRDRISYTIGVIEGNYWKDWVFAKEKMADKQFNLEGFKKGLTEIQNPATLSESIEEITDELNAWVGWKFDKDVDDLTAKLADNLTGLDDNTKAFMKSMTFLDQNEHADGVEITGKEKGTQYKILKPGHGNPPTATDTIVLHYKGAQYDGKEFCNTRTAGAPDEVALNKLMPLGLRDALVLMKPGQVCTVWVRPAAAKDAPSKTVKLNPMSMLIYEVELVEVKAAK